MAIRSTNFDASSLASLRHAKNVQMNAAHAQTQMKTGRRITSVKDDSSGSSIAATLKARNAGAEEGMRNLQEASAALCIAESTLNILADNLNSLKSLGVRAASALRGAVGITLIKKEISAVKLGMSKAIKAAEYNGKQLIDGSLQDVAVKYGIGSLTFSIECCTLGQNGLHLTDIQPNIDANIGNITKFISVCNFAIDKVSVIRGNLGAIQVLVDAAIESTQANIDRTEEARSTIEDIDALEAQVHATTAQSQQNLALQALLLALQNNFKNASTGMQTMQLLMQS